MTTVWICQSCGSGNVSSDASCHLCGHSRPPYTTRYPKETK